MTRDAGALAAFAVAAPGLEPLVAGELAALGVVGTAAVEGGVEFGATMRQIGEANLQLRTASRVLVRLARFRAVTFAELERGARKVPWERVVGPGDRVLLRVTCRKSRLYHSGAVAERLMRDIAGRAGAQGTTAAREEAEDDPGAAQLIVVRLEHNECTVSADSSGAHLHRRGYRTAVTPAPLRETLAAAVVMASGWDRRAPLLDPFCGSGTIPIEAALLAARIAPGRHRGFRFLHWPGFDPALWSRVMERARLEERTDDMPEIVGSDRSGAAIRAATANAARAGVERCIRFVQADASRLDPLPATPGWVVSNPPYGVRLGGSDAARQALDRLGRRLAAPGQWHQALLIPAARRNGSRAEVLRTVNGGLAVRLALSRL